MFEKKSYILLTVLLFYVHWNYIILWCSCSKKISNKVLPRISQVCDTLLTVIQKIDFDAFNFFVVIVNKIDFAAAQCSSLIFVINCTLRLWDAISCFGQQFFF